jgi:hypothetical protein
MSLPLRLDHEIVAAFLGALVVIAPTRARADAPVRSARVDYEAPAACPDGRAFEGQIRARSSRIALRADAATVIRVIVETAGGPTQQRHVDGSCADVVAALGLIAALALDPMASTSTAPTPTAPAADATSAKPEEPKPAPTAPATPPPAKGTERAAPASDELPPGAELAKHDWRWSMGAGVGVTGGVATAPLVSVPLFVDVAQVSRGLVSPAFRLRFERASTDQGGASFTWTAGSLEGCPFALVGGPLRVWPCARVEAGTLSATGDAAHSKSAARPWLSVGAVARARLSVVGGLFVELEGEAFAPFVRDRFYLEPDTTVHRATPVAVAGAASLGAAFW